MAQPIYKKSQELNDGFLLDYSVWQVVILVRVCVVRNADISGNLYIVCLCKKRSENIKRAGD